MRFLVARVVHEVNTRIEYIKHKRLMPNALNNLEARIHMKTTGALVFRPVGF